MTNDIQYYCVGFTWKGTDPESQLSRFMQNGVWENGFEDKYLELVKSVKVGSRIAAKTTFTRKDVDETVSILQIYATGTVVENLEDGQVLRIKWDKAFEPFEIRNKGAYRSTISRVNNLGTIREIFKNDNIPLAEGQIIFYSIEEFKKEYHLFPCFVYVRDKWDDFGYKTQYSIDYWSSQKESVNIGVAKFYNKENATGDLPESFTSLSDSYCSLGQSNNYYSNLREKLDKKIADNYLDSVNDLAINKGLLEAFEHELGVKTSLLRSSEAQKSLQEGKRTYKNIKIENLFKFTFSTKIGNAIDTHNIRFDFSESDNLPFRIKVIIGKNGTGKTQYLGRLASTLSGLEQQGEFSTKYLPPFSRVIAVSYSLFDRFPRPKQTNL